MEQEGPDSLSTAFPGLLVTLQQHRAFLRELSRDLLCGDIPSPVLPSLDFYDAQSVKTAARLTDPELMQAWERAGRLQTKFIEAGGECIEAAKRGDRGAALDQLDLLLGVESALTDLLLTSSLREVTLAFQARERQLAARYEQDFLQAARIGRLSARLSDHTIVDSDASLAELFGSKPTALRGKDARSLIGEDAWRALTDGVRTRETRRVPVRIAREGAPALSLELVGYVQTSGGRSTLHCFVVNRSQAEAEAEQRRLLSAAIEASDQIVMITNARQEIVYVNPAFTRITGYEPREALGRTPRFLQGPDTSQATRVSLHEALASGRLAYAEILNYRKSGEPFWVETSIVPVRNPLGELTHWSAITRDVSERKQQEREITRLAMEDYLTGLPNRRAAEARLAIEWSRARRDGVSFAVAVVDIDRFKLINDQYGHHVGDRALTHVARALSRNMRGGDWIARWGGEEFLVCFHDLDAKGALTAGERVRKLVKSKPLKLPQGEVQLTVSIGVALYHKGVQSLDAQIAQADSLLYEAKQSGRDKVLAGGVSDGRRGSLVWEGSQVQSALHEKRVVAAYQPIVDLRTGETVAEEALARIVARDRTLVAAQQFILAAEALHLISAIDRTVSHDAIERGARAIEQGAGARARFINLSTQFLAEKERVNALLELATARQMSTAVRAGDAMVIELTERQTGDMTRLKQHLRPLLDAGFKLALDDFGSGYSSFMYLTDLPVSYLKIEGWMVHRVASDSRTRQLVQTIVNTAHTFEVKTVAECVEDAPSAQVLCDLGVDWAQGYFFAKPELGAPEAGAVSGPAPGGTDS
jgi:diguanylate cyclase (GGDEF)-like protein/PAS domain S-box-containing protein